MVLDKAILEKMAGEAVVAFNVSQLPICGVEQENCNNLSYVKIHRTAGLSGVIVQEDVGSQHIVLTQNWAQLPVLTFLSLTPEVQ